MTAISIHAPARGATIFSIRLPASHLFQSTLPRGERLPSYSDSCFAVIFQSTLPRGERRSSSVQSSNFGDFNPRSREGSDEVLNESAASTLLISIHAPARGATGKRGILGIFKWISIHAPARGATKREDVYFPHFVNFNPRSREGSDDKQPLRLVLLVNFNPRSREGSDDQALSGKFPPFSFQSTLPRGERRRRFSRNSCCSVFQSTLPRGERRFSR